MTGGSREDILSDALLKVARRWPHISTLEYPRAYVRRVVVNTYLSDRRTARRRCTTTVDDPEPLIGTSPDPASEVVARDEVERLLARLPRQQKVAVVLRYLLDQSDEQIAEVLGCAPVTVRSHLSQARTTLKLAATTAATRK